MTTTVGRVYCPGGRVPENGEIVRNPDWAGVLRALCRAEAEARHKGRVAGIEAARKAFYEGEIAETIIDFIASNPVANTIASSSKSRPP